MCEDLRRCADRIAGEHGVGIDITEAVYFPPCAFEPSLVAAIEEGAKALGHPVRRLASGAGHDAVYVARTCPTAMIFVPCEGGISHNEIENARPEHLAAGAQVLLRAMLEVAGR
jgi:N-carbamoyl-L-amino-acid hydrolase